MFDEINTVIWEALPYLGIAVVGVTVSIALLGIVALVFLRRGRVRKRPTLYTPYLKGWGIVIFI